MAILRTIETQDDDFDREQPLPWPWREPKIKRHRKLRRPTDRERQEGRLEIERELSELRVEETGREVIVVCGRHFFAVRV